MHERLFGFKNMYSYLSLDITCSSMLKSYIFLLQIDVIVYYYIVKSFFV